MSIDTDAQQQAAAFAAVVVRRSSSRYAAGLVTAVACLWAPDALATCDQAFGATRDGDSAAMQLLTECVNSGSEASARGQAFLYRAWLHYQEGRFKDAASDQERSFSLTSNISYQSLINQSLFLRLAQRKDESLVFAKLAQAVESSSGDKTSMKTQYHLGWSYFDLGRYDEAVAAFSRGIPFQPDYSAVYWLRAQSYEKLGDGPRAKADLQTLSALLQTSRGREDLGKWSAAATEKLKAYGFPVQ